MSYKFVKLTTFYPEYLKDFYARRSDVAFLPYKEQLASLMSEGFAWADFLTNALKLLGVDAHELVVNAQSLQAAWAHEHGLDKPGVDIVVEQLRFLKPDVLFIEDPFIFNIEWISNIRREIPSLKQVVGWCCAPYQPEMLHQFHSFDFMVTCTPGFVDNFRQAGLDAYLSVHAFAPESLAKISISSEKKGPDVLFIGSLIPGAGFHDTRGALLEALVDHNISLDIYGKLFQPPLLRTAAKSVLRQVADMAVKIGIPEETLVRVPGMRRIVSQRRTPVPKRFSGVLARRMKPPIYGQAMLKELAAAKIGLNNHGEVAGRYAGNMRLFETTGVGTCLVTDWKENMPSLFDVDSEVVLFKSPEECVEKVRWLLAHPNERELIAKAGQARTLRDYTYARKAESLDAIIRGRFK